MFQSTRPRGARRRCIHFYIVCFQFQSTRPRGARPPTRDVPFAINEFQSTRPRGARRISITSALSDFLFQSTRPRGARPFLQLCRNCLSSFNPRAHVGRDRDSARVLSMKSSFNPRAHVGRDTACSSDDERPGVSIHAPTWGATGQRTR